MPEMKVPMALIIETKMYVNGVTPTVRRVYKALRLCGMDPADACKVTAGYVMGTGEGQVTMKPVTDA